MKYILILLIFFSSLFAQTTWTDEQILNIANRIKELEYSDSVNTEQLALYEQLVLQYDVQTNLDSLYINYQKQQIGLLRVNEELYRKQLQIVKPAWYKNKYLYFFYGFGTLYLSSYVAGNIK